MGLVEGVQCAIRVASDAGDGVLFPPIDANAQRQLDAAVRARMISNPPPRTPPVHVVVYDVEAPAARKRWPRTTSSAVAVAVGAALGQWRAISCGVAAGRRQGKR